MKAENNDNKHFFWKCSNCKKEHKIPTLFCNGCGAQRPKKYSFKYNFINTDNPKNIKIIDWIIMIVAFGLSIFCISLFIFNLNYSRSFLVCFFGSFLLLSLIIIIYALRNLFFSKNISFWQRIVVLFVTILFNPVVMFIIFMSVSSCFGPRGCMSKTRRTNKSRFAKACSELVLNKNTGVVHHKKICADHLPREKNLCQNLSSSQISHIHQSKEIYIAETLSKTAEDAYKEKLLIEAIKNSPTSTHLYRPLIRLWGKNKEHERIHEFLEASVDYMKGLLGMPNISARVEKKYRKALLEIMQRQNRAKYLAKMSKVT